MLKEYFLPYASCAHCAMKFSDCNPTNISSTNCAMHHQHVFTNFAIESYMIPIIVQQFLIDVMNRKIVDPIKMRDAHETSPAKAFDSNEIEQFWRSYEVAVPTDLEVIWESIESGLHRYLEVIQYFKCFEGRIKKEKYATFWLIGTETA